MRDAPKYISSDPFGSLLRLLTLLQGPTGCPWDRVQTAENHLEHLLEEIGEAQSALSGEGDVGEEAGDLFLNALFFLSSTAKREKTTEERLIFRLYNKLVSRHPHVFGDVIATTPEEALAVWKTAKEQES
ncbi:nucleotide pyrophosphohydrolase [bacterium]|nr:nucleotide pyrophosphohydrolase [bacterium]